MTHPTETDARKYLDNLDPWELEDQIRAIDPDDTLDPWDLDAALVASALHYLQAYQQTNASL